MKLRILDHTIRIRISQSEMTALADGTEIRTICPLIPDELKLVVTPKELGEMDLVSQNNTIHLFIPAHIVSDLSKPDQVGFDHFFQFNNQTVALKFEKDFKCLTDRNEDETDLFENPLAKHDC